MGTPKSDYVLVLKDDAYWIAEKKKAYIMTKEPSAEDNPLVIAEVYQIIESIEYNGFETPADAYSFLSVYKESI